MLLSLNIDYKTFFKNVKDQIQQSQIKASIKVNQELLLLYRQLWKQVLKIQSEAERGDKVVPLLAKDLKAGQRKAFLVDRTQLHIESIDEKDERI